MSLLAELASWVALAAGSVLLVIGGIGLVRLPDFYSRMHAAGIVDTLATWLVAGGLALQAGLGLVTIKLAVIVAFVVVTSPVATHALARAALHGRLEPLTRAAPGEEQPPSTP